jgi:hypothetical protein
MVQWLIPHVNLIGLRGAQIKDYFWVCLGGCLQKRVEFELVESEVDALPSIGHLPIH